MIIVHRAINRDRKDITPKRVVSVIIDFVKKKKKT